MFRRSSKEFEDNVGNRRVPGGRMFIEAGRVRALATIDKAQLSQHANR